MKLIDKMYLVLTSEDDEIDEDVSATMAFNSKWKVIYFLGAQVWSVFTWEYIFKSWHLYKAHLQSKQLQDSLLSNMS